MYCLLGGTVTIVKKYSRVNMSQKLLLEKSFVVNCYPSKSTIQELALQTGMDKKRVRAWFGHQRLRTKNGKGNLKNRCMEEVYGRGVWKGEGTQGL